MNITFDDNLITGNKTIDSQHQELIDRIRQFVAACESGDSKIKAIKMLDYLDEYTNFHFQEEEELQKKLARQVELNDLLSMDNSSEEESQDEEPKAVDLIESHQFEADDDDVTVEFENMILYLTRTEQDPAKVDYYFNDRDTGCMKDCGSWVDDYYFSANLKEAVKAVIKDKDITEQILSVNNGDRFEEITGTLPVRQSGGQSM